VRSTIQRAKLALKLRKAGFVYPLITVQEADRTGLSLSAACALLEKESGKGHNVFGHDPTIYAGAGKVTKGKYITYRTLRRNSGNKLMQGVGPCQLTWWATQDEADRLGGCWKPRFNMRVGFSNMERLIHLYGNHDGPRRYNGSGPAAEAYAKDFEAKRRYWHRYLTS
jgi:hypothetical protein